MIGSWIGVLVFAASVIVFLYTYAITFGVLRPGTPHPRDVAMNVAIFGAFALHHSVFARTPVRALVARTVPPPGERTLYVVLASVLLILVLVAWRPLAGVVWQLGGPARWAAYAGQVFGLSLMVWSARIVDVRELVGLRPAPSASAIAFRASGPYRWIRHPLYAGWLLVTCAPAVMTMDRLVFGALGAAYILVAMPLEEATLRRVAGTAYARYVAHVRWRLLPGIY